MKPVFTFIVFSLCFLLKVQTPYGIKLPANVGNSDAIEMETVLYYITQNQ